MDTGSCCLLTHVNILSVLVYGVVDTAADITIMSGKLIATVAAAARLKKKDFRKPDKVPRTYERKVFRLDGCIKMDIIFQGMTINTIVYVKMDAANQLLLLECVCAQLGIVKNHPALQASKVNKSIFADALVPSIWVKLIQSVKLLPLGRIQGGGPWDSPLPRPAGRPVS